MYIISSFSQLIDQYEAVSYGNALFAAFLLLPLCQNQDVKYRIQLWCHHPISIKMMTINEQQLPQSIDRWLYPTEQDETLLMKYAQMMKSGLVDPDRNPVIWRIAHHHVSRYLEETPIDSAFNQQLRLV